MWKLAQQLGSMWSLEHVSSCMHLLLRVLTGSFLFTSGNTQFITIACNHPVQSTQLTAHTQSDFCSLVNTCHPYLSRILYSFWIPQFCFECLWGQFFQSHRWVRSCDSWFFFLHHWTWFPVLSMLSEATFL